MDFQTIATLAVILLAIILFVTEKLSVDLIGLVIICALVITGVISPVEGIKGFSNTATITVAFMFVMSAALLKTGALQFVAYKLSDIFKKNFRLGLVMMMLLIALISAFINNTPVVAVFIPVVIQIAKSTGKSPSQLLIPLSFASIFGGTCTYIGTSTNVLVSGIAQDFGFEGFSMFQLMPFGIILVLVGTLYMMLVGSRLLPKRRKNDEDLEEKFGMREYLTEIELQDSTDSIGKTIMQSSLVNDLKIDILEINRQGTRYNLPQGDFILHSGDILKVRCNLSNIKELKSRAKVLEGSSLKMAGDNLQGTGTSLVEMVISSNSEFDGKNLQELDFRRRYRASPLAIRHREEVLHEDLYDIKLKAGDVLLAEVKSHYVKELRKKEMSQNAPFALLSSDIVIDFNKKQFLIVTSILATVIALATFEVLDIVISVMAGVVALVLLNILNMREVYKAINWKIVFLLAGVLSFGVALSNTGLDQKIASGLLNQLGAFGPVIVLSGLYLVTSFLTELMSNNATAALMAPIAIAISTQLGLVPTPFLMAVTFAASASFMTPIGYQTNTMVYTAGSYKFTDFTKVGVSLNLLFWILATIFLPMIFPFQSL
ncbi:SLC13 family permease [Marivirga salinae]|uniref:SLC13 family permease n=1 Tax=Marivirga salinarum TaxID=3059078 RepID=A0AA51NC17_9BACT|nr:SLC13 family permease [Marivirga sp. BDSF4-3]WMN10855.1 SLC13 family permease [Marivirga sp. BDSF4-3]